MIEVRNLTKRYGDHAAVNDLSFRVEDGQIYGFLGPNGAGKSTTMNIIAGYIGPTAGEIYVNGFSVTEEPEKAKATIGYLPEIPPVYPEMTVREYLLFAAELKKVPKKEKKEQVLQVMEELSLTDVSDRLIRNLSKGFRQRVGIAQAIIGNPQTLILDEPTVGLDPKQITEIRALIRELGKRHTVILSSHILSEVSEICDQVIVIAKGKLVALDTPENLSGAGKRSVLRITCEGDADRAYSAVSEVIQIPADAVTVGEDGLLRIVIGTESGEDIRTKVSRALFDAGCIISEMHREQATLENVFLELTDAGTSAGEEEKKNTGDTEKAEKNGKTGKRERRTFREAVTDFFFESEEIEEDEEADD
ncbi:MAG: ABC transporter ATP-binding protein [Lachnospiraceae bacterium]|nr:ABC transporter ATP-binding protein [Lachnospiraceae bacterium]